MTVLPQQHEADLLLQVRGDETVRDLPFHNVIWNGEIAATFMAACLWRKADMKGRQGAVFDIPMRPPELRILRGSHIFSIG